MNPSYVDSHLFVKHPLQGNLQNLLAAATGAIEDMEATLLLEADPATIARETVGRWPFEIPVLDEGGIYATHEEVQGEVRDAFSGGIRRDVLMQQYVYHVPFTGNAA